ncbi:MAG: Gfo/Idh/MocA family oxidoreductase [Candidatus Latescibacterota bacterium]|nr:Gfo/Idh/MocA family oxidoreductase [Candidatus Latescibacterota bacterium]
MDTVRVGIIGLGGMGSNHAGYLSRGEIPGARLAAVCDVEPARLQNVSEKYGEDVQAFDSADALFEAKCIDAVIVATPHYFHPPLVTQALERGYHAMSEKPAGVYTKQVRQMNEVAAKSDRVFGVMFNQRTRGDHQKLKELVESGELGEIKRTIYIINDWFRAQSYYDSGGWRATWAGEGGGVLANQCPHNLDLWQWICGMPERIRAFCHFGKYHDIEVEDDVTAYAEYANGATGVFITSTGEAPGTNRLEISADNGKVVLEGGKITFWRTRVPSSQFLKEWPNGFGSPEVWKCEVPFRGGGEEHRGITKNWVQAIRQGTPLLASGDEGVRGVELANAMMLSTWTDDWVDIPVDEERFYEELQKRVAQSEVKKEGGKVMDVDGTF